MTNNKTTSPFSDYISNEDYHSRTGWYSSTQLKRWLPEHFSAPAASVAGALNFGNLVHTMVLEPKIFETDYTILDPAVLGLKADGSLAANPTATKAYKDAVTEALTIGRIPVTIDEVAKSQLILDALHDHELASAYLFGDDGVNEQSLFVTDNDGRQHKARYDRYLPDYATIVDLKTTSSLPSINDITRSIVNFGYDLSAAHYMEVGRLAGLDVDGFVLIFVTSKPPHYVTIVELKDDFLERGRILRDLALDRISGLEEYYPGASQVFEVSPPRWARI